MAYYVLGEKKMASHTKLFRSCSLLMTALFVYSASVQLNDPDWYSWFPLYACASVVNLMNWANPSKRIKHTAKATLWLGIFLFLKVTIEDFLTAKAGFWSLDLAERLVREKIGSGLVAISMILHLEASSATKHLMPIIPNYVDYGMAALVIFSFGLPFVFVVRTGEMKFDR